MADDDKFERALKLLEADEVEPALSIFHELAVSANDKDSKVSYTLGELTALVRLGSTAEARQLLQNSSALFKGTDEAEARAELIAIQINSVEDKWDAVLLGLERLLRRYAEILQDPQLRDVYEEAQLRRGMRLAYLEQFREALPVLEEALDFYPPLLSAEFYFELGRCYLEADDVSNAKEALTKAMSLGLDDARAASAAWNLAVLLMRQGDNEQALETLRCAEKHANSAGVSKQNIHKALAICLHKMGMIDQAQHYAREGKCKL